jgi:hypothetical protein
MYVVTSSHWNEADAFAGPVLRTVGTHRAKGKGEIDRAVVWLPGSVKIDVVSPAIVR